jgi:hypothetical protein
MRAPNEGVGTPNDRGLRVSIGLCAAILVVTALNFSGPIFAPLAFALLIIAIIWPIQKRLQVWLPKLVALVLTMVGTVVVVTEFASLITWGFGRVGRFVISDASRYQLLYGQVAEWLEGHGIAVAGLWAEHFNVTWMIGLFRDLTIRMNSMLLPLGDRRRVHRRADRHRGADALRAAPINPLDCRSAGRLRAAENCGGAGQRAGIAGPGEAMIATEATRSGHSLRRAAQVARPPGVARRS